MNIDLTKQEVIELLMWGENYIRDIGIEKARECEACGLLAKLQEALTVFNPKIPERVYDEDYI